MSRASLLPWCSRWGKWRWKLSRCLSPLPIDSNRNQGERNRDLRFFSSALRFFLLYIYHKRWENGQGSGPEMARRKRLRDESRRDRGMLLMIGDCNWRKYAFEWRRESWEGLFYIYTGRDKRKEWERKGVGTEGVSWFLKEYVFWTGVESWNRLKRETLACEIRVFYFIYLFFVARYNWGKLSRGSWTRLMEVHASCIRLHLSRGGTVGWSVDMLGHGMCRPVCTKPGPYFTFTVEQR